MSSSRLCHLVVAVGLVGCGGGGPSGNSDAPSAAPAQFTAAGKTEQFTASQCTVQSGSTFYQLMCAVPGGTPEINLIVQAPSAVGTYDQTTANTIVSVVDPTTSTNISSSSGTCTVVVTATAGPGQGAWQGHFDVAQGSTSATGTFDLPVM